MLLLDFDILSHLQAREDVKNKLFSMNYPFYP